MEPPPNFSGAGGGGGGGWRPPRPSPRKELQLAGPRPSPLQVSKDSHKIRKPPPQPPRPPLPPHGLRHAVPLPPPEHLQPVIIYSVSPKVIHVEESKFMTTVQRLTGLSPTGGAGDFSPAARLASIERASPTGRDHRAAEISLSDEDIMSILEGMELGQGQIPGILSPAASMLPPVPAGLFSPAAGPQQSFLQDLSPFWHNSPSSALFSAPIIFSPSPSSADLFNQFVQF